MPGLPDPTPARSTTATVGLVSSLVLAAASPAGVLAQEAGEAAGYVHLEEFEVAPVHVEAFLEAAGEIAEAARLADLDPAYGWEIYRWDNTFYVVSWPRSMARFDDPDAFYRLFEGTPGEAPLQAAFASLEELDLTMRDLVYREKPEWSYTPETPAFAEGEHAGVFVVRNWVKFGGQETADRTARKLMALLAEAGSPYPVYGLECRIGDAGLVEFVVAHDGLENFYGKHSLEKTLTEAGLQERWAAQLTERQAVLRDTESFPAEYLPELSYPGR